MATQAERAEHADAAFLGLRYLRAINRLGTQLLDHDFWRALNPALAVTDTPFARPLDPLPSAWARNPVTQERLRVEGYVLTPEPLVDQEELQRLADGIGNVVAAGLPPGLALVYDDVYRLFARLVPALEPLLGPSPRMVFDEGWIYHVPPGDGARSLWTAFPPHRDWQGADPAVLEGGAPSQLTAWIPFADASTDDSCLYVVPADADSGYRSTSREITPAQFRLQDVRAVPATAGQVLLMTSHVVHWGGRSSRWSTHPRISGSFFFNRRDRAIPPGQQEVLLDRDLSLRERLQWAVRTLQLITGPDHITDVLRAMGLSEDRPRSARRD